MLSADELKFTSYDSMASEYDKMLSGTPRALWVRDAFLHLVLQTIPVGSTLLDFGCGTGTDAKWYARHGYFVVAYDPSKGMMDQLRKKCSNEIGDGKISAISGDKSVLIQDMKNRRLAQGIVSNFAVVNEVSDLEGLFNFFDKCLEPGGWLILSVLNPRVWITSDNSSFLRRIIGRVSGGKLMNNALKAGTKLHSTRRLEEASSCHFTKVAQASVGMFVNNRKGGTDWTRPSGPAERIEHDLWKTQPFSRLGRFIFIVWRKKSLPQG